MFIRLPTMPTTWPTLSSGFPSAVTYGPRKAGTALINAPGI